MKQHIYNSTVEWTGNKGSGTFDYRSYSRSHSIIIPGKPVLLGSSDSNFRGEKTKHNPEDLFLSSISSCHMLWYLHLCADAGIIVMNYVDKASGVMDLNPNGSGQFSEVTLHPRVTISAESETELALTIHESAHKMCFIANSCNFPIKLSPEISTIS